MDTGITIENTSSFVFQMDLLTLNLHLAETETAPEPQAQAHECALREMRSLIVSHA